MNIRMKSVVGAVVIMVGAFVTTPTALASPTTPPVQTALHNSMDIGKGSTITEGDGTYTLKLTDGRVLWLFSDSFFSNLQPYGQPNPLGTMVQNQVLVQASTTSSTFTEVWLHGTGNSDFTPPQSGCDREWPSGSSQINSRTVQIMLKCESGGTTQRVDLATLHINSGTSGWTSSISSTAVNTAALEMGSCGTIDFTQDAYWWAPDDATYIYGDEGCPSQFSAYVMLAKVTGHDLTSTWQYWNGSGWTTNRFQAAPLSDTGNNFIVHGGAELSVVGDGARMQWRMISTDLGIGPSIWEYTAPSPMGPWSGKVIYTMPETGMQGNNTDCTLSTYGAKEHPEFETSGGQAVVSYNVNIDISSCSDAFTTGYTGSMGALQNYRPVILGLDP